MASATDIYSPAGYERRLFEATKLYEGKEDKSKIYPYWKVWIDPTLAGEVATTETGLVVQVPLFVNEGDTIRVVRRTGEYKTRL